MKSYECVLIARPDLTPSQVETLSKEVSQLVVDNGGTVHRTESWGLRTLAYRIKKNKKAYYLYQEIIMAAEGLEEFNRVIGLHEDIMRSLVVFVESFTDGDSAIIRNKDERDNTYRSRNDRPAPRRDEGYRARAPRPQASNEVEGAA